MLINSYRNPGTGDRVHDPAFLVGERSVLNRYREIKKLLSFPAERPG